jgi:hypothetical protein
VTALDLALLVGLRAPHLGRIAFKSLENEEWQVAALEVAVASLAMGRPRPAVMAGRGPGMVGGPEPGTLTIEASLTGEGVQHVRAALASAGEARAGWVRLELKELPDSSELDNLTSSEDENTSEEGG